MSEFYPRHLKNVFLAVIIKDVCFLLLAKFETTKTFMGIMPYTYYIIVLYEILFQIPKISRARRIVTVRQ
jgi:hypothetical protein